MCSERSTSHRRSPFILVASSTSPVSRMLQYHRDSLPKTIRDEALLWVSLQHAARTFTNRQFPRTCQPAPEDRMARSVVAALPNRLHCVQVLHPRPPHLILYQTSRLSLVLVAWHAATLPPIFVLMVGNRHPLHSALAHHQARGPPLLVEPPLRNSVFGILYQHIRCKAQLKRTLTPAQLLLLLRSRTVLVEDRILSEDGHGALLAARIRIFL